MCYPGRARVWLVTLIAYVCLIPTAFGRDAGIRSQVGKCNAGILAEHQAEELFMQVPANVPEGGRFLVEFVLSDRLIAEQSVIVRSAGQGVRLLPGARDIIRWLRAAEAKKAGAVMIRVTSAEKQLQLVSLTQLETASSAIRAARGNTRSSNGLKAAVNGACEDQCDLQYEECQAECGPRGSTECDICTQYWMNCLQSCPNCDTWVEVSRTFIGRDYQGSLNIFGVAYCVMEEYYLVEETNPAGCYPNRIVCDTDSDTMFYDFTNNTPERSECCATFDCQGENCP